MIDTFPINPKGAQLRVDFSLSLYQQLCNLGLLEYNYARQELVEFSAYLYLFGGFISNEAESQHTFYILSNMNLLGFSHSNRLRLALLSSYRNRSLYNQYLDDFPNWFSEDNVEELQKLGGVIKFSQSLNDSQTAPINKLIIERLEDGDYCLNIYHHGPIVAEKYRAERHFKHLERALDGDLILQYIDESL